MSKFTKNTALLMLMGFCSLASIAQSTISGTVKDSDGEAVYAAMVYLVGTTNGDVTDDTGAYEIQTDAEGVMTISVSFVGYKVIKQEVTLVKGADKTVDFTLEQDALGLDEVIVTGVVNPKARLESSVSMSTLKPSTIEQSSPRNTAEIFRSIPGIRSEASAGEGNTNITVRGVPISAGGSKYLQLQEDGLPIFQFGDMAFATADIFLRYDASVGRIEAIRGGSASTLGSNSPAGIINFISKTGDVESGTIATTFGLDYDTKRTDFSFGTPISESVSMHFGGFFRQGEGVRTAGYTANSGGQFKANITKRFKKGYARVYFKHINDRSAGYLPMPLKVEGTNADPTLSSVDGFDAGHGTIHSPYLLQNLTEDGDGGRRRANVADGMHPESTYFGTEISADLGNGWNVINRSRLAFNKGRFVSPFPSELTTAAAIAADSSYAGPNSTLVYADNGEAFGNGFDGNGLVMRVHMFDTELNNFNNLTSDTRITKSFNEKIGITAGLFNSVQNVGMSWLWNSYLMEVNGEDGRLLNMVDTTGASFSENGLYAYGVPFWGNCCQRNYDVSYVTTAPYFGLEVEATEALNIEASVRFDLGQARGHFSGANQSTIDMNNDGVISGPETSVSAIDNANVTTVNYDYDFVSFSAGANYKMNESSALFARFSQGGAAKADRLLFSGLDYTDGDKLNALDYLTQIELGYKKRFKRGGIYATLFSATTKEEGGFEATTQRIIENDYQSIGLELEGVYQANDLTVRGGLTFVDASIETEGDTKGNTPRRQPDLVYSLSTSYTIAQKHAIGISLIGQTESFAQDNNELVMPGFTMLNLFATATLSEGLTVSINGNNLLDTFGITESEEGSIVENQVNYIRARSIAGRSTSLTVRYNF